MKKLIMVRHGEYVCEGGLSGWGRSQIRNLAEKLGPVVRGESVLILSSTADRASESAEILSDSFGVGFERHDILWSDNSHLFDLPGTLELVRSRKDDADVIVLVTHYEYVERFPAYFVREELGIQAPRCVIEKGEAWILDCLEKTVVHVSW